MSNPDSATIHLRYERPPLSDNVTMHRMQRSRWVKVLRQQAKVHAQHLGLAGFGPCTVTLTWFVRTRHRRDADNPTPTLKALCDGLVDAGLVPDDTPDLMHKRMPVIHYDPTCTPHLELTIERGTP